jgi:hypothetical protein
MKIKSLICTRAGLFFLLLVSLMFNSGAYGQTSPKIKPSIIVKIWQLDKAVTVIDDVVADKSKEAKATDPKVFISRVLYGMDWIDPNRSVVIGIDLEKDQPDIAVLIPFLKPNNDFKTAYNAIQQTDYYIVSVPFEIEKSISNVFESALIQASVQKADKLFEIEIAVKELLKKGDAQIKKLLTNVKHPPENKKKSGASLSTFEIQTVLLKILEKAHQLELLSVGIDFDDNILTSELALKAIKGSDIYRLFSSDYTYTMIDKYKPEHEITFNTHGYDIKAMMALINTCFGKVYRKTGLDFGSIARISQYFTGELAGGLSYTGQNVRFETISVLKETKTNTNFLKTVYLPWMLKYGQTLAQVAGIKSGANQKNLFQTTPPSKVSGLDVVGIKGRIPVSATTGGAAAPTVKGWLKFNARMAKLGSFLLTAPDDGRLAELINLTKTFQNKPAQGLLMTMKMDMSGYLSALTTMVPGLSKRDLPPPKVKAITIGADLKNGHAAIASAMPLNDIKILNAYFQELESAVMVADAPKEQSAPSIQPQEKDSAKEPKAETPVENATYWLNRGLLCATYGNDKAAIQYFEKALKLEPDKKEAYFNQGVSYGQLGKYDSALASLNKALLLGSPEDLCLYARARIYLLAGEAAKAHEDFVRAAILGNIDAQNYLEKFSY